MDSQDRSWYLQSYLLDTALSGETTHGGQPADSWPGARDDGQGSVALAAHRRHRSDGSGEAGKRQDASTTGLAAQDVAEDRLAPKPSSHFTFPLAGSSEALLRGPGGTPAQVSPASEVPVPMSVATDKPDYAPGSVATFTVSGVRP
ncbi:hypothetical protein AB4144_06030, partial [Rhizobiaceae sp. 2RAB30]